MVIPLANPNTKNISDNAEVLGKLYLFTCCPGNTMITASTTYRVSEVNNRIRIFFTYYDAKNPMKKT
jgi:hypothetical protein